MKIAFYAPLKSPRHPRPSGDRLVARLLERAIGAGGFDVELASEFRSWEGKGERDRQIELQSEAEAIAHRLSETYADEGSRPSLWFTYHVYHKAPDWIGPAVSSRLNIPYVIAEASYAPKQDNGPWALGHRQCRLAIASASAVVSLNRDDDPCLRGLLGPSCELLELRPFVALEDFESCSADREAIAGRWSLPAGRPWLVCVAMMRDGDKLSSYRELGRALEVAAAERWHLVVVGDGPSRAGVAEALRPFGARTTFTGLLEPEEICALLKSADLYVWPAVNEAYGMSLLEAQACGLPVVASAVGGVPQIVAHEDTGLLAPPNDPAALGACVRRLLRDAAARRDMGERARLKCETEHDITRATGALAGLFHRLVTSRDHRPA